MITDSKLKEFHKIKKIVKNKNKILDINQKKIRKLGFKDKFKLPGEFQFKNFLMAALASKLCGGKISSISEHLKKIKPVNGRLELIRTLPNEAKIFIDYAHTPDALENVMTALVKQFNKKITLVFGCGGERDKSKRKLMARVANNFCDKIIVTDDNPRNEIPSKIRNEIFKYISSKNKFNIGRRNKAIEYSLVHSSYEEIILIAGKGHESIQDYGKKKYFTSDKKIIKNIKIKLYNLSPKI